MKLMHPWFQTPISFPENRIQVLVIENRALFSKMVAELCAQSEGEAGAFILSDKELLDRASALDVVLDYTIPAYRDCSVAAFLYPALAERGYSSLRFARAGAVSHMVYLHKMGFAEQQGALVKKLR